MILRSQNDFSSEPIKQKIEAAIVTHVYRQGHIGLVASVISASIIFLGLLSKEQNNAMLIAWYSAFWLVTLIRFWNINEYFQAPPGENINFWRTIFTFGAFLNGLCWGFLGSVLLPINNMAQLSLTLFILAGITSGSVPMLSGIRASAFAFLGATLIPLISTFFIVNKNMFVLFGVGLSVYTCFLALLANRTHSLVRDAMTFHFENDILLQNLSKAKHELEQTNIKLDHAAKHDPLTNLANRSLFEINFENAIWRSQQDQKILALLYLDIDKFKEVNDAYGHHIGDHLLQKVVERLNRKLVKNNSAARLGGDEITVMSENVIDPENIVTLCREICASLAKPFDIKNYTISITASIGISIYPIDGRNPEMLLKNADKAMYVAKEKGGNNFHFNTELATIKSILQSSAKNAIFTNKINSDR